MGLIARPAARSAVLPPNQPDVPSSRTSKSGRPSRKAKTTRGSVTGTSTSRDSRGKRKPSAVAHQTPVPRSGPSVAQLPPSDPVGAPKKSLGASSRWAPLTDEGAMRPPEKLRRLEELAGPPARVSIRSPEARVSWVLGVEVCVARTFIEHVRSLLVTPPSAEEVAVCLEAHPRLRAPWVLADQLAEEAHAREHPEKVGAERRKPARPRGGAPHARPDTFDPSRVPLRNLRACPHGVPITDVCRICSPYKKGQALRLEDAQGSPGAYLGLARP